MAAGWRVTGGAVAHASSKGRYVCGASPSCTDRAWRVTDPGRVKMCEKCRLALRKEMGLDRI